MSNKPDDVANAVARRAGEVGQRPRTTAEEAQSARIGTMLELLKKQKPEIAKLLPAEMDIDRFMRIALSVLRTTPKLDQCTPSSFLGALMTCAQLALEPGPTGEAYIIPRGKNIGTYEQPNWIQEAHFELGYQGMIALFWRHPLAANIDTQAVHENDEFDFQYGTDGYLRHKPARKDRGDVICWYAVARLTNGGFLFRVMYRDEVEAHRLRSTQPNGTAWKNDYGPMAEKTCIRVMFKKLPRHAQIALALTHDASVRNDYTADGLDTRPEYIEGELADKDQDPEPTEAETAAMAGAHA